jgi:restriction endonuclease Mrr
MTFTEAAAEVLRVVGRPLHYKEITAIAIEKSLLSHVGKSPEVTMGSRLAALFKKQGDENPLVRIRPGVFALKEWEVNGQLKQMLARAKSAARSAARDENVDVDAAELPLDIGPAPDAAAPAPPAPAVADRQAAVEVAGETETQPAASAQPPEPPPAASAQLPEPPPAAVDDRPTPVEPQVALSEEPVPAPPDSAPATASPSNDDDERGEPAVDPETAARAELVAGASSVFEEEDDDDRPILGPDAGPGDREGRRRRRRRRRGKGGIESANGVAYSATPLPAEIEPGDLSVAEPRPAPQPSAPHPVVLDVGSSALESLALDDFGGKDMADAIAVLLSAFDRSAGPVSLRQIAEAAQKRARLSGDVQQLQSQIAASVRADNMRRTAMGLRPRFRFVAGRVALTDWLLSADLARLEQEAQAAVDRYRDAARKAFARKLQELPGHAFVELALLTLERVGFRHVRAVRRAGIPGHEAHYTAIHDTGAAEIASALVIRRDGREIGRERVTELRGSLHHYGPATVGWLITSGPVLSGAREEAAANAANTIVVVDGLALARLCEQYDVAVVRSTLPVAIPDLDMFEALRAS